MKRIKPLGLSVNDSVAKRITRWLLTALGMVLFCTFMAVVVIEWMAGCGESYIDAKGRTHLYECVFINFPPKE
jgi:lipopolysaccharide/colanic/teichoic acid biosynthesis glycosyltransferase